MATTATPGLASTEARPTEVRAVRIGAAALLIAVLSLISMLWLDGEPLIEWDSVPWFGLVFLASVLPVGEEQGSPYLVLDLPILLACSFVLGPATAGFVALLAATSPQELRRRTSISRAVWNHSQISLSVIAAGLVFLGLGGDSKEWPAALLVGEVALV